MKNNFIFALAPLLFLGSCAVPAYLPDSNHIDVNAYGAYIQVVHYKQTVKRGKQVKEYGAKIDGELISVERDTMFILSQTDKNVVRLPVQDVSEYMVRYAKPKMYGWSIPLYLLLTIPHGLGLVFTAPVNMVTTISVTTSGSNAFRYTEETLKIKDLHMFSRFPQGIPSNVRMSEIKPYIEPR